MFVSCYVLHECVHRSEQVLHDSSSFSLFLSLSFSFSLSLSLSLFSFLSFSFSLLGQRKNDPCCRTNSHEHYPPRAWMATGRVIYCGPPSGFMTLPYVSVTKAHMVEIIVLPGFPVAFSKMFYSSKRIYGGSRRGIKKEMRYLELRILRSVDGRNFNNKKNKRTRFFA